MLSSTSTTGPTSTSRQVSSRTSRISAACSASPVSTAPPGRLHSPLSGSCPRCTSSTRSPSRITAPTATMGRAGYFRKSTNPQILKSSDSHDLHHNPLLALAVELRVEDLLPWTEIERPAGNRQDHLMTHDRALQVRVGVVFPGVMMPVIEAGGRQLLEPRLEVVDQALLPVVHVHARRDVHRRDEDRSLLHRALLHDGGHVIGDANEFLLLLRVEHQVVGEDRHSVNAASALRSSAAVTPARKRLRPAAAIIAALSVASVRLGRNAGISRRVPRSCTSLRNRLLAETPPATPTLFA